MKSTTHNFAQVPRADIPRSKLDRSHGLKTTFNAGYLVPVFIDEALPGDTFSVKLTAFSRLATPIFPIMDNMRMTTFFFDVPLRLLWENWERFNGAQDNPGDSTDYLIPQMSPPSGGYTSQSLGDYLGLPVGVEGFAHSALPMRAYNLIWNEWFRDENLQDRVPFTRGDGPDAPADYELLRRGKRHDYITSALPWPQKGESVELPLGDRAPVIGLGKVTSTFTSSNTAVHETGGLSTTVYAGSQSISGTGEGIYHVEQDPDNPGYPGIYASLAEATASTVNQLRQAFQIQRLLERDARGGTRYTEIVRSHFGVTSPDARLQRPEYLGGGTSPVNINPVAQTSGSDAATSPQGNLAGIGTAVLRRHGFTKSFTEHSIVIGLACVSADLTYQQGLARMWSRKTRFDFYWPALSNIGEQAILNKEIYCDGSEADEQVWGYQERYGEYRYKPSQITGRMRSQDPASLDAWHLAQDFGSLPALNGQFIEENPPLDRCIAVTDEPHFIYDSYVQFNCARPMPTYGVPGLIDHF